MAKRKGIRQQLKQLTSPGPTLEEQVQDLVTQAKYSTAIRKLQQGLKRDPDQQLTITEADIWLLQGKQEFEQAKYAQAETSLQKALSLGLYDDTYYWLAKSLLWQQKSTAALELFQSAFDDKTLPKDLGGCYLKLLFLNDKDDTVKKLVKSEAKRFYAPHLHWARGAIALTAGEPKAALPHFKKMGRPASPGDSLTTWQAYAHQRAGSWSQAEQDLSLVSPPFGVSIFRPRVAKHPALQQLTLVQIAHTDRAPSEFFDIDNPGLPEQNAVWVLEFLHLVRAENFHDAAHLALDFTDEITSAYPALKDLHRPLMLMAGNQAGQEQELGCTAAFWGEIVNEPFDPKLALNLYKALKAIGDHRQAQRVLNQVVSWVQKEASQHPQTWPESRLNPTLAKLNCWLADCQMSLGHRKDAQRSVEKAERLAPKHPDVIGRKGLQLFSKDQLQAAIPLLTQALEAGCQFREVYSTLLELLEDEPDAVKDIRRKFGKHFGDVGVDTEVEIPAWVEALTFQNYSVMEQFVRDQKQTPPIKAFTIFLEAAEDQPSSSQKIKLNQEKAVPQWEQLLGSSSPAEQVEIVKAIYLIIQQHARRNLKGMVALQRSYLSKLAELAAQQVPGADIAYLVISAIAHPTPETIKPIADPILSRATQPANTLAKAQLALHSFGPNRALLPLIEAWSKQEPQNPLLLLARATFHPRKSGQYETFYEQGFEIARRLQDAEALQAYREEDWFAAQAMTRRVVGPDMDFLGGGGPIDMLDMVRRMAREAFGEDVPPEILAQLLPELAAQMAGFVDDDDEDEDDDPFFLPLPRRRGRKSAKKRRF